MVMTGFSSALPMGSGAGFGGDAPEMAAAEAATHGISTVVAGAVTALQSACPRGPSAPCYVAVRTAPPLRRPITLRRKDKEQKDMYCHRFVSGSSLTSLEPIAIPPAPGGGGGGTGVLCLRSKRVTAAVQTAATSTVVLAWDPEPPPPEAEGHPHAAGRRHVSCLAIVDVPGMRVRTAVAVEWSSAVLYDSKTGSVVTVSFSGSQTLVVDELDATTLKPRWRYRLPLSVAWLVHAPRVSDGYLIFVGSEQPFIGTVFSVDLVNAELYEQDPPAVLAGRPTPPRRRLPRSRFVERLGSEARLGADMAGRCDTAEAPDLARVPRDRSGPAPTAGKGAG